MSSCAFKKNSPLVSVCIPVYNHESYVQDCIQSVIDQDYQHIELIIIDDGSKDNSVEKIQHMIPQCETRFKRFEFISRPNKGVSHTMNEALAWSQGTYFSGCASDDMMLDCKISTLLKYMEQNESCAGVFGGLKMFHDDPGNITRYIKPKNKRFSFSDIFLLNTTLPGPGMLLRLSCINSVGGYNPATKIEDWELWLKLTSKGFHLDTIEDYVSLYRRHEHNTSGNFALMHHEMERLAYQYKEHPLYEQCMIKLRCVRFRDFATIDKKKALGMLPQIIPSSIRDPRLYQGLLHLILKW